MSSYPLMLDGDTLDAVVIGGGVVGTRKALALLDSGASVRVVAPSVSDALQSAAAANGRLTIRHGHYATTDLGAATLVVAATDDAATNAAIAADARAAGRLVNVASAPELGNCATPAVHRSGDIVVAVTTGGVPRAAVRIRDAVARVFDGRYASALHELSALRKRSLDRGDRARWADASAALIGKDFCAEVESGAFAERLAEWR
ncbi:MAG TPA: NAD(P)-dependent oxidoreductase [Gemmatimonadaceae bacterium]|jgi:siroheme synthase-like protein